MCGITGYVGSRSAVDVSLSSLKRLEYRGYDSAGVAFPNCAEVTVVRAQGRIAHLENALAQVECQSQVAIAHTRWATHGRPSETNAHPHRDASGRIAVVHNGIIENYAALRRELSTEGFVFVSETDTEVLPHLIARELSGRSIAEAIRAALKQVTGSYAIAVICQDAPDTVFAARKDSPLIIGLGKGEHFLASDIPAVLQYTRSVLLLEDGDFVTMTPDSVHITDLEGNPITRAPLKVTWDDTAAEKGGYPHFMLKEIHEGPRTVRNTLRGRLTEAGEIVLPDLPFTPDDWQRFQRLVIVGCGTAYHAGVLGKRLFEQWLRRPVEVCVASEFRYSDPIVDSHALALLISQSGETADTLAALREARAKGATTLAIVNVVGSSLAREADAVLLTQAGPEIGVASTKAYLAQLTALSLLGLFLTQNTEHAERIGLPDYLAALRGLPALMERCLAQEAEIARLGALLAQRSCFFYLGRGCDSALALEAALKLKEISYIHAEAYPAGEMKHGPLALVEPGVAVVGFCTQSDTREKMISNLKEVKAREGTVLAVLREGDAIPDCADYVVRVPATLDLLLPIVAMVPMQILAYYVARARGCEIDQPRNLAKSVTVE
jgi:glucosamine--fructose-6-phosphate aminotransferase (isomerizing)